MRTEDRHGALDEVGIPPTDGPLTFEELALAARNRGILAEALRYDVTPTGMHYLLTHYDVPHVDPATWRLGVGGAVSMPLSLSMEELREMPSRTLAVTLECAGNGRALLSPRPVSNPWLTEAVSTAEWTGVPLRYVLDTADVLPDARDIVFTGADHGTERGVEQDYARGLPVDEAKRAEMLLAYEMNGEPLPPQHGAPLRLIVPGWYGMASVKWLVRIEAITRPFDGFQNAVAYRYRSESGAESEPVTRINVRSAIVPPGFPDFLTRRRVVDAGRVEIRGRAWAGATPVAHVELGVDGVWRDATLDEPVGPYAWRGWSCTWDAEPGEHVLASRATDERGATQPDEPPWNFGGFGNNAVRSMRVTVR